MLNLNLGQKLSISGGALFMLGWVAFLGCNSKLVPQFTFHALGSNPCDVTSYGVSILIQDLLSFTADSKLEGNDSCKLRHLLESSLSSGFCPRNL